MPKTGASYKHVWLKRESHVWAGVITAIARKERHAPAIDQCDMVERLPEVGFWPHVAVTFKPRSWLCVGRVSMEPIASGEVVVEDTTNVNGEVVMFGQVRAGQDRVDNAACLPFIREGPGE